MRLSRRAGRTLIGICFVIAISTLTLPSSLGFAVLEYVGWTRCPLGYGHPAGSHLASPAHPSSSNPTAAGGPLRLFFNCSIWTGNPSAPTANAFAVDSRGKFAFVGSSSAAAAAAAAAAAGSPSLAVNLQGGFVIPGLIDSHLHLISGGLSLARLDLRSVSSKQDFIAAVAAAVHRLAPGKWLLGHNWDESRWGGEPPSALWIDGATPHNPVFLVRMDAHQGLANSVALQLANVTAATPDPVGGVIVRADHDTPTGLLADAAMLLIRMPPASLAERRQALQAAQAHALARGITAVHDMGRVAFQEGEDAAWDDLEHIYLPAADDGSLRLRVNAFVALSTWRRMAEWVRHLGMTHPGGRLSWGGVKEFADGSLGSRTALMHEPYADDPTTSGTRTVELQQLRQWTAAADAAGLQVAVHAIGDRAVEDVLHVYRTLPPRDAAADAMAGRRPRRHRIEHAQHLSGPETAAAMAEAGVVVTPNPLHLVADASILGQRLGRDRAGAGRAYAFQTLLRAGVAATFATDWPVVPLEPLSGTLRAAVARRDAEGVLGSDAAAHIVWGPEEGVAADDALALQTRSAAFAGFQERSIGSIEQGKEADFVVLSGSPLEGQRVSVRQTYVGGGCEYGCQPADEVVRGRHDEL